MIPINFRKTEQVDVTSPFKKFITNNFNKKLWEESSPLFTQFAELRSKIIKIPTINAPSPQVYEAVHTYLKYIHAFSSRFKFAYGKTFVTVSFAWYDCFATKKTKVVKSLNINFERLSVLFNLAALHSLEACVQDRTAVEGIKESCKQFQIAAGILTMVRDQADSDANVRRDSPDFSTDTLTMFINLMLAQAQVCFYEKAKLDGLGAKVMSKLANQISENYSEILSMINRDPLNKMVDKYFTAIMSMQQNIFKALAYYWMSKNDFAEVEKTSSGFGIGIARLKLGMKFLTRASVHTSLASKSLNDTLNHVQSVMSEALQKAEERNFKIYMDVIPNEDKVEALQSVSLVQAVPMKDDITGWDTAFEVLNRLIPAEVRAMLDEYKGRLNEVLNTQAAKVAASDDEITALFKQFNLPHALNAIHPEEGVPEGLWNRICDVKSRGGFQHVKSMVEGLSTVSTNSETMIEDVNGDLMKEQTDDEMIRQQYGSKWRRLPSSALNQHLHQQIQGYKEKLQVAKQSDGVISSKLEGNKEFIEKLDLTREELEKKVPVQNRIENIDEAPEVVELKAVLKAIEELKRERSDLLKQMVNDMEGDNIIPELIEVYQQKRTKDQVFAQETLKYDENKTKIDEEINKQPNILVQLSEANEKFSALTKRLDVSKERGTFFEGLENGISAFHEIVTNASQGANFYNQLNSRLTQLNQQVSDFTFSRGVEKNDLIFQINTGQGGAGGAGGAQGGAGGAGGAHGGAGGPGGEQGGPGNFQFNANFGGTMHQNPYANVQNDLGTNPQTDSVTNYSGGQGQGGYSYQDPNAGK